MGSLRTLRTKTPDEIRECRARLLELLADAIYSLDEPKFFDIVGRVNDLNAYFDQRDTTPLLAACGRENEKFVLCLLERNVDVNLGGCVSGHTPLMAAVWSVNPRVSVRITKMLLSGGVNVNATTPWGDTALMHAAKRPSRTNVKLL